MAGRVFESHVQTASSSRLFLETQRPRLEPTSTVLEVQGSSVLDIFEQYFWRSVQIPTRLLALDSGEHLLVQGMPRANKKWIRGLRAESALEELGELESIEERAYRFGCGCDPGRILAIVHGMYQEKADDLFHGESQVEVSCPRCGRRYWITREDFDRGPGRTGAA